jgi:hypothetical protein
MMRVGICALERIRQVHTATSGVALRGVEAVNLQQVLLHSRFDVLGKPRDAVFLAFAVAYDHLMVGQIHVFHPQTHALQQAQPGAIPQRGHNPRGARERSEPRRDLVPGQDNRQSRRLFGAPAVVQLADVMLENLLIQKQPGAEGLALGGGGNAPCESERREQLLHCQGPHVAGMPFAVQQDEAFDPAQRGVFSA